MGEIRLPIPAKLFVGMLSSDAVLFTECESLMIEEYGAIDYKSEILPWNLTDYYREEMGTNIRRKFIFFKELIDPGLLAGIKIFTNQIEKRFSERTPAGTRRRINLDPGYVTEAKVILATTKDFSHRIYIGQHIYAEATLRYSSKDRSFIPCEYTYSDFRSETYKQIFNATRNLLRRGLNRK